MASPNPSSFSALRSKLNAMKKEKEGGGGDPPPQQQANKQQQHHQVKNNNTTKNALSSSPINATPSKPTVAEQMALASVWEQRGLVANWVSELAEESKEIMPLPPHQQQQQTTNNVAHRNSAPAASAASAASVTPTKLLFGKRNSNVTQHGNLSVGEMHHQNSTANNNNYQQQQQLLFASSSSASAASIARSRVLLAPLSNTAATATATSNAMMMASSASSPLMALKGARDLAAVDNMAASKDMSSVSSPITTTMTTMVGHNALSVASLQRMVDKLGEMDRGRKTHTVMSEEESELSSTTTDPPPFPSPLSSPSPPSALHTAGLFAAAEHLSYLLDADHEAGRPCNGLEGPLLRSILAELFKAAYVPTRDETDETELVGGKGGRKAGRKKRGDVVSVVGGSLESAAVGSEDDDEEEESREDGSGDGEGENKESHSISNGGVGKSGGEDEESALFSPQYLKDRRETSASAVALAKRRRLEAKAGRRSTRSKQTVAVTQHLAAMGLLPAEAATLQKYLSGIGVAAAAAATAPNRRTKSVIVVEDDDATGKDGGRSVEGMAMEKRGNGDDADTTAQQFHQQPKIFELATAQLDRSLQILAKKRAAMKALSEAQHLGQRVVVSCWNRNARLTLLKINFSAWRGVSRRQETVATAARAFVTRMARRDVQQTHFFAWRLLTKTEIFRRNQRQLQVVLQSIQQEEVTANNAASDASDKIEEMTMIIARLKEEKYHWRNVEKKFLMEAVENSCSYGNMWRAVARDMLTFVRDMNTVESLSDGTRNVKLLAEAMQKDSGNNKSAAVVGVDVGLGGGGGGQTFPIVGAFDPNNIANGVGNSYNNSTGTSLWPAAPAIACFGNGPSSRAQLFEQLGTATAFLTLGGELSSSSSQQQSSTAAQTLTMMAATSSRSTAAADPSASPQLSQRKELSSRNTNAAQSNVSATNNNSGASNNNSSSAVPSPMIPFLNKSTRISIPAAADLAGKTILPWVVTRIKQAIQSLLDVNKQQQQERALFDAAAAATNQMGESTTSSSFAATTTDNRGNPSSSIWCEECSANEAKILQLLKQNRIRCNNFGSDLRDGRTFILLLFALLQEGRLTEAYERERQALIRFKRQRRAEELRLVKWEIAKRKHERKQQKRRAREEKEKEKQRMMMVAENNKGTQRNMATRKRTTSVSLVDTNTDHFEAEEAAAQKRGGGDDDDTTTTTSTDEDEEADRESYESDEIDEELEQLYYKTKYGGGDYNPSSSFSFTDGTNNGNAKSTSMLDDRYLRLFAKRPCGHCSHNTLAVTLLALLDDHYCVHGTFYAPHNHHNQHHGASPVPAGGVSGGGSIASSTVAGGGGGQGGASPLASPHGVGLQSSSPSSSRAQQVNSNTAATASHLLPLTPQSQRNNKSSTTTNGNGGESNTNNASSSSAAVSPQSAPQASLAAMANKKRMAEVLRLMGMLRLRLPLFVSPNHSQIGHDAEAFFPSTSASSSSAAATSNANANTAGAATSANSHKSGGSSNNTSDNIQNNPFIGSAMRLLATERSDFYRHAINHFDPAAFVGPAVLSAHASVNSNASAIIAAMSPPQPFGGGGGATATSVVGTNNSNHQNAFAQALAAEEEKLIAAGVGRIAVPYAHTIDAVERAMRAAVVAASTIVDQQEVLFSKAADRMTSSFVSNALAGMRAGERDMYGNSRRLNNHHQNNNATSGGTVNQQQQQQATAAADLVEHHYFKEIVMHSGPETRGNSRGASSPVDNAVSASGEGGGAFFATNNRQRSLSAATSAELTDRNNNNKQQQAAIMDNIALGLSRTTAATTASILSIYAEPSVAAAMNKAQRSTTVNGTYSPPPRGGNSQSAAARGGGNNTATAGNAPPPYPSALPPIAPEEIVQTLLTGSGNSTSSSFSHANPTFMTTEDLLMGSTDFGFLFLYTLWSHYSAPQAPAVILPPKLTRSSFRNTSTTIAPPPSSSSAANDDSESMRRWRNKKRRDKKNKMRTRKGDESGGGAGASSSDFDSSFCESDDDEEDDVNNGASNARSDNNNGDGGGAAVIPTVSEVKLVRNAFGEYVGAYKQWLAERSILQHYALYVATSKYRSDKHLWVGNKDYSPMHSAAVVASAAIFADPPPLVPVGAEVNHSVTYSSGAVQVTRLNNFTLAANLARGVNHNTLIEAFSPSTTTAKPTTMTLLRAGIGGSNPNNPFSAFADQQQNDNAIYGGGANTQQRRRSFNNMMNSPLSQTLNNTTNADRNLLISRGSNNNNHGPNTNNFASVIGATVTVSQSSFQSPLLLTNNHNNVSFPPATGGASFRSNSPNRSFTSFTTAATAAQFNGANNNIVSANSFSLATTANNRSISPSSFRRPQSTATNSPANANNNNGGGQTTNTNLIPIKDILASFAAAVASRITAEEEGAATTDVWEDEMSMQSTTSSNPSSTTTTALVSCLVPHRVAKAIPHAMLQHYVYQHKRSLLATDANGPTTMSSNDVSSRHASLVVGAGYSSNKANGVIQSSSASSSLPLSNGPSNNALLPTLNVVRGGAIGVACRESLFTIARHIQPYAIGDSTVRALMLMTIRGGGGQMMNVGGADDSPHPILSPALQAILTTIIPKRLMRPHTAVAREALTSASSNQLGDASSNNNAADGATNKKSVPKSSAAEAKEAAAQRRQSIAEAISNAMALAIRKNSTAATMNLPASRGGGAAKLPANDTTTATTTVSSPLLLNNNANNKEDDALLPPAYAYRSPSERARHDYYTFLLLQCAAGDADGFGWAGALVTALAANASEALVSDVVKGVEAEEEGRRRKAKEQQNTADPYRYVNRPASQQENAEKKTGQRRASNEPIAATSIRASSSRNGKQQNNQRRPAAAVCVSESLPTPATIARMGHLFTSFALSSSSASSTSTTAPTLLFPAAKTTKSSPLTEHEAEDAKTAVAYFNTLLQGLFVKARRDGEVNQNITSTRRGKKQTKKKKEQSPLSVLREEAVPFLDEVRRWIATEVSDLLHQEVYQYKRGQLNLSNPLSQQLAAAAGIHSQLQQVRRANGETVLRRVADEGGSTVSTNNNGRSAASSSAGGGAGEFDKRFKTADDMSVKVRLNPAIFSPTVTSSSSSTAAADSAATSQQPTSNNDNSGGNGSNTSNPANHAAAFSDARNHLLTRVLLTPEELRRITAPYSAQTGRYGYVAPTAEELIAARLSPTTTAASIIGAVSPPTVKVKIKTSSSKNKKNQSQRTEGNNNNDDDRNGAEANDLSHVAATDGDSFGELSYSALRKRKRIERAKRRSERQRIQAQKAKEEEEAAAAAATNSNKMLVGIDGIQATLAMSMTTSPAAAALANPTATTTDEEEGHEKNVNDNEADEEDARKHREIQEDFRRREEAEKQRTQKQKKEAERRAMEEVLKKRSQPLPPLLISDEMVSRVANALIFANIQHSVNVFQLTSLSQTAEVSLAGLFDSYATATMGGGGGGGISGLVDAVVSSVLTSDVPYANIIMSPFFAAAAGTNSTTTKMNAAVSGGDTLAFNPQHPQVVGGSRGQIEQLLLAAEKSLARLPRHDAIIMGEGVGVASAVGGGELNNSAGGPSSTASGGGEGGGGGGGGGGDSGRPFATARPAVGGVGADGNTSRLKSMMTSRGAAGGGGGPSKRVVAVGGSIVSTTSTAITAFAPSGVPQNLDAIITALGNDDNEDDEGNATNEAGASPPPSQHQQTARQGGGVLAPFTTTGAMGFLLGTASTTQTLFDAAFGAKALKRRSGFLPPALAPLLPWLDGGGVASSAASPLARVPPAAIDMLMTSSNNSNAAGRSGGTAATSSFASKSLQQQHLLRLASAATPSLYLAAESVLLQSALASTLVGGASAKQHIGGNSGNNNSSLLTSRGAAAMGTYRANNGTNLYSEAQQSVLGNGNGVSLFFNPSPSSSSSLTLANGSGNTANNRNYAANNSPSSSSSHYLPSPAIERDACRLIERSVAVVSHALLEECIVPAAYYFFGDSSTNNNHYERSESGGDGSITTPTLVKTNKGKNQQPLNNQTLLGEHIAAIGGKGLNDGTRQKEAPPLTTYSHSREDDGNNNNASNPLQPPSASSHATATPQRAATEGALSILEREMAEIERLHRSGHKTIDETVLDTFMASNNTNSKGNTAKTMSAIAFDGSAAAACNFWDLLSFTPAVGISFADFSKMCSDAGIVGVSATHSASSATIRMLTHAQLWNIFVTACCKEIETTMTAMQQQQSLTVVNTNANKSSTAVSDTPQTIARQQKRGGGDDIPSIQIDSIDDTAAAPAPSTTPRKAMKGGGMGGQATKSTSSSPSFSTSNQQMHQPLTTAQKVALLWTALIGSSARPSSRRGDGEEERGEEELPTHMVGSSSQEPPAAAIVGGLPPRPVAAALLRIGRQGLLAALIAVALARYGPNNHSHPHSISKASSALSTMRLSAKLHAKHLLARVGERRLRREAAHRRAVKCAARREAKRCAVRAEAVKAEEARNAVEACLRLRQQQQQQVGSGGGEIAARTPRGVASPNTSLPLVGLVVDDDDDKDETTALLRRDFDCAADDGDCGNEDDKSFVSSDSSFNGEVTHFDLYSSSNTSSRQWPTSDDEGNGKGDRNQTAASSYCSSDFSSGDEEDSLDNAATAAFGVGVTPLSLDNGFYYNARWYQEAEGGGGGSGDEGATSGKGRSCGENGKGKRRTKRSKRSNSKSPPEMLLHHPSLVADALALLIDRDLSRCRPQHRLLAGNSKHHSMLSSNTAVSAALMAAVRKAAVFAEVEISKYALSSKDDHDDDDEDGSAAFEPHHQVTKANNHKGISEERRMSNSLSATTISAQTTVSPRMAVAALMALSAMNNHHHLNVELGDYNCTALWSNLTVRAELLRYATVSRAVVGTAAAVQQPRQQQPAAPPPVVVTNNGGSSHSNALLPPCHSRRGGLSRSQSQPQRVSLAVAIPKALLADAVRVMQLVGNSVVTQIMLAQQAVHRGSRKGVNFNGGGGMGPLTSRPTARGTARGGPQKSARGGAVLPSTRGGGGGGILSPTSNLLLTASNVAASSTTSPLNTTDDNNASSLLFSKSGGVGSAAKRQPPLHVTLSARQYLQTALVLPAMLREVYFPPSSPSLSAPSLSSGGAAAAESVTALINFSHFVVALHRGGIGVWDDISNADAVTAAATYSPVSSPTSMRATPLPNRFGNSNNGVRRSTAITNSNSCGYYWCMLPLSVAAAVFLAVGHSSAVIQSIADAILVRSACNSNDSTTPISNIGSGDDSRDKCGRGGGGGGSVEGHMELLIKSYEAEERRRVQRQLLASANSGGGAINLLSNAILLRRGQEASSFANPLSADKSTDQMDDEDERGPSSTLTAGGETSAAVTARYISGSTTARPLPSWNNGAAANNSAAPPPLLSSTEKGEATTLGFVRKIKQDASNTKNENAPPPHFSPPPPPPKSLVLSSLPPILEGRGGSQCGGDEEEDGWLCRGIGFCAFAHTCRCRSGCGAAAVTITHSEFETAISLLATLPQVQQGLVRSAASAGTTTTMVGGRPKPPHSPATEAASSSSAPQQQEAPSTSFTLNADQSSSALDKTIAFNNNNMSGGHHSTTAPSASFSAATTNTTTTNTTTTTPTTTTPTTAAPSASAAAQLMALQPLPIRLTWLLQRLHGHCEAWRAREEASVAMRHSRLVAHLVSTMSTVAQQ